MNCATTLHHVDALRTGELPADVSRQVERHLAGCRSCRETGHELSELAGRLGERPSEPAASCWPAVEEALFHGLDRLEPPTGGAYWVAFSARGVTAIVPGDTPRPEVEATHRRRFDRDLVSRPLPERFARQVVAALQGRAPAEPAVDLTGLSGLERTVLEELVKIPRGQVRQYGWIARRAGRPRAARAVGSFCAKNPVPFLVPCHRVVPASGGVGSYAFGPAMKRALLEREGVAVAAL